MERTDIGQITTELEELLMEGEKTEDDSLLRTDPEQMEESWMPDTSEEPQQERQEQMQKQQLEQGEPVTALREKNMDGILAAFFVPVLIMILIFIFRGIFPFGEESFLRTDMYHQYAPFFSEFQHKLKNGQSLMYSWDVGLGVNFWALYAYYLASPLNWLLFLWPKKYVIEFMTYMIVLKTGLCGGTMAWYLRKHYQTNQFGIAFFGIFYALSGYMAAYSWNIMWLDCIILFPVIMFGIEQLVREGKGLLYCVALALSILSNYYISIMTCMFMVIYFIALLFLEKKMTWEKLIARSFCFGIYSLLSGALSAFVLLPEIYALDATASGEVSFPKDFTQYFTIFDMIARHIGNVKTEQGLDHWPNIYCGVAVLAFFVLYLLCSRINLKEKIIYSLLLLFFMASFSMNVLNYVWHGLHYPNSLPCRQSYIYIFLLLSICFHAYIHLKEFSHQQIMGAFAGAVGFVILSQKLVTAEHFHFIVFYVAVLFLLLYLGITLMYRKETYSRRMILILALLLISVETGVNMAVTSITTTSRTAYTKDNAAVERLVASVQPAKDFFRVEKLSRKTKNDGAWMHFPSVSLFSSTAQADLSTLLKKLGCESSTNAYSITGSTPLVDAFFAVQYGLYSEKPKESTLRTKIAEDEGVYLYENTYKLSLGFVTDRDFETRWHRNLGNPADVQNSLCDAVGAGQVLELNTDTFCEGSTMRFTPIESGEYYAYVENKKIEKVKIITPDGNRTLSNVNRGYFLELGYCSAGETITLQTEDSSENMWADIYRVSEKGLSEVCEKLSADSWHLSNWTDTRLSGKVNAGEGGILFTTIPFDEGWTVTVDGRMTPTEKVLDAFVGIPVAAGEHEVTLDYTAAGLKPGALISAVGLLILILLMVGERFLIRKKQNPETEDYEEDFEDEDFDFEDLEAYEEEKIDEKRR